MRRKLKSEALRTEFAVQIKELRLNKMLIGRDARRHLNDISLVLLSTFLKIFEPTSALQQPEDHLEMLLLVAGILSPNTTKIKPPTVTNQPRMK